MGNVPLLDGWIENLEGAFRRLAPEKKPEREQPRKAVSPPKVKAPDGLFTSPKTCMAGSVDRGRLLVDGKHDFRGTILDLPDEGLWKLQPGGGDALIEELHAFGWLDDLAAFRSAEAIAMAQALVFSWIDDHGYRRDAVWRSPIAGRRLLRLLENAWMIGAMRGEDDRSKFAGTIERHVQMLRGRIRDETRGLPRLEALAGLYRGEIACDPDSVAAERAALALVEEATSMFSGSDGFATRNPEEFLAATGLLQNCVAEMGRIGRLPEPKLRQTIRLAGENLRVLRHADGSLVRAHGGGNPGPGVLDRAIVDSCASSKPTGNVAMGFVRLSAGRTTAIIDAASPRSGWESANAHASTLAFELVSGACPVIVSCGPATGLSDEMRHFARQTAAHSTIEVGSVPSSRFDSPVFQKGKRNEIFVVVPERVVVDQFPGPDDITAIVSHDGYVPLFGLTHLRRIDLRKDGKILWGEDTLWHMTPEDRRMFEGSVAGRNGRQPFAVRFHVHPDAKVSLGKSRRRARIELANREEWEFRFEGQASLKIEDSVYFDEASYANRESVQIVLRSEFRRGSSQLRWEFGCYRNL